jgi:hypothetical protein
VKQTDRERFILLADSMPGADNALDGRGQDGGGTPASEQLEFAFG